LGYLWTFQKFAKLRKAGLSVTLCRLSVLFVPTSLIKAFPYAKIMTLEGALKPTTKNSLMMWLSKLLFIVIDI
jgi:hypothetical protein